jgi:hypothetical protein
VASLEAALPGLLTGDGAVAALVGTRVYANRLPQGVVPPAVRYQRISTPRLRTLAGAGGYATPRFQVDCYGTTHVQAVALAAAVRAALEDYAGTANGVTIDFIAADNESGEWEEEVEKNREMLEFIIGHKE